MIIMVRLTMNGVMPMHSDLRSDQLHVTVDLLIMTIRDDRLHLLLSRRVSPPYEGQWALPGSFVGMNEAAEEAAERLLKEMLPVSEAFLEQLYTFTRADRDPRGRVISVAYLVIIPFRRLAAALGEHSPFHLFEVQLDACGLNLSDGAEQRLGPADLAFDHGSIVETGIRRLRGKIDYTEIGFHFLEDPDAFALSELQTIYEAVLGNALDTSNVRRSILNRYENTGRLEQTSQAEKHGRGRPAVLYRLKSRSC